MSDDKPQYPVKVVLSNEQGQDVGEATINAPGIHDFANMPVGKYKVTFTPLGEFKFVGENPKTFIARECGCLLVTVSMENIDTGNGSKNDKGNLIKPVLIPAISVALMAFLEPSFISCAVPSSSLRNQPKITPRPIRKTSGNLTNPSSQRPINPNQFIPGFSKRLETCILENLKSLLDFPGLYEVVLPVLDKDIENDEFVSHIIYLYEKYDQVRLVLEDCDISSVEQLIEDADEQSETINTSMYVLITGNDVNIRNESNLDGRIISQASNGDTFLLNTVEFYTLSNRNRVDIISSKGWYPIILSDGRKGYIYSLYGTIYRQTE